MKRWPGHRGRNLGATDVDHHRGAIFDSGVKERKGNALSSNWRKVPARHSTDFGAVEQHSLTFARRTSTFNQQTAKEAMRTAVPFGLKGDSSSEVALVETHNPTEPGLERRDPRAKFMTVKGEAGFETKCVTRSESCRCDASIKNPLPERRSSISGHGDLNTVFARIAGASDNDGGAADLNTSDGETAYCCCLGRHRGKSLTRFWTLNSEHGSTGRDVDNLRDKGSFGKRIDHSISVGCVGHHVKTGLIDPPHDDVVEYRCVVGIKQMGVLRLARRHSVQIVCERPLEGFKSAFAGYADGAEVRNIEDDGPRPASPVLRDRAVGVVERHVPSAEGHHLGAQADVMIVKR